MGRLSHLCARVTLPKPASTQRVATLSCPLTVACLALAFEFPEILALGVLSVFSPPSPGGGSGCSEPRATGRGVSGKSSRARAALGSVRVAACSEHGCAPMSSLCAGDSRFLE